MGIAELVVFVCACAGISQDNAALTAEKILMAAQAGMRGQEELIEPVQRWPPISREEPGVISAARLAHKVPKEAKKSFDRATKLAKEGKTAEAIAALEESIRLDPEFAVAHNNLGVQYYLENRLVDCERALRRAIALDSAYAEAYSNLGVLSLATNNPGEAEAMARKALALAPRNIEAQRLLNETLRRLK
jgi:tetratricopeptide (TPR) repeat protein